MNSLPSFAAGWFAILLMLAGSGTALAWGGSGHRAVCEIAFQELDREAREQVKALIRKDRQYRTFADACTWADGPPRQREFDHFMNFPRSTRAITENACVSADTCLFAAIERDTGVLANPGSTDEERLEALKLLGHWVGDIHQPMHTTFADDRGANSVEAIVEIDGELVETNLHAIWDSWIIGERLGDDYRRIAERLRASVTDADRALWQFDSPIEWANESFQIATAPAARYCVDREGACWYSSDNMILDAGEPRRRLTIDDGYAAAHIATIERRLRQAGVRLGALLNRVLK